MQHLSDSFGISVDHSCMGCRIGYFHTFFQCGVFRCSIFFFVRFQKNGAQSRTQSQCVQCRQTDSDSHSHTELTIECSCCTSHETYRNEYGHHNQRNRYDSTTQFIHGIDRSQTGRCITLVKLGMHTLDDHNRIVDHNRNSKHERT